MCSGNGKCERVWCYGDTADKYMEEVISWGDRINWRFLETSETFWENGRIQETVREIQIDCIDRILLKIAERYASTTQ